MECEYFAQKLKSTIADIKAFEETAAPAGFSLLWDETDKKYGYINNYTGEVTQGKVSHFLYRSYFFIVKWLKIN